ncbi:MAG TPA: hypothetical protein VHW04_10615 [Solirubrobacteraceae bacterium]|nr:hypothetical protein [Solirubrobacteraceae bacterium]
MASLWMIAIAVFSVAGAAQTSPEPTAEVAVEQRTRRATAVPVIAVAVGFGLLVFDQRHDRLLPDLAVVIAAVLLALLVSARQF